ncbi:MAG: hypothetical protein U9R66_00860, partial [Thermodesulfobacteriota bacterium]|nr:hypothetical protein [Thermodesulfobacteriota bacterium]
AGLRMSGLSIFNGLACCAEIVEDIFCCIAALFISPDWLAQVGALDSSERRIAKKSRIIIKEPQ